MIRGPVHERVLCRDLVPNAHHLGGSSCQTIWSDGRIPVRAVGNDDRVLEHVPKLCRGIENDRGESLDHGVESPDNLAESAWRIKKTNYYFQSSTVHAKICKIDRLTTFSSLREFVCR